MLRKNLKTGRIGTLLSKAMVDLAFTLFQVLGKTWELLKTRKAKPSSVAKFPKYAPFFNFRSNPDKIKCAPGLALEMLTMFASGMKSVA